jgi:lipid-binding SYLF domain-containing protein
MKAHTKTTFQPKSMLLGALAALVLGATGGPAMASTGASDARVGDQDARPAVVKDAEKTVASFRQTDPGLEHFLSSAVGYAVFPSVGKGAVGIGGAYGRGVLFEHGKPVGRTTLTQITVGPQLGGQAYSEIVFFENEAAISAFKKGETAMSAQVSAVVANAGASANARYAQGVAVFTQAKEGLMAEASVGGQRFGYRAFPRM